MSAHLVRNRYKKKAYYKQLVESSLIANHSSNCYLIIWDDKRHKSESYSVWWLIFVKWVSNLICIYKFIIGYQLEK